MQVFKFVLDFLMSSTFDLSLLLYVIRLAGWLKHCNLSLCTGHSRWFCANPGLGQVWCHLLCSLSGRQNRSCQGRPFQRAVHPDGYHWSNRCLCVRRQLSWCGFLWGNQSCVDPCSHTAGFHSCVELPSAGTPSLFTASVSGTHMNILHPPCLVHLIQFLAITALCIAAYRLAHAH